jgi:DNA topoisomerase I
MARVHRVRRDTPGYRRRRRGKGFLYLDQHGRPIRDAHRLERIRTLAIPPAWRDVWICAEEHGHLQATGTDDAGRRQYLYHPDWRRQRDRAKFERIEDFAASLPTLRRQVAHDLRSRGFRRERILACAVRLLDRGSFRVGTDVRASTSFGLATLRREHVIVGRRTVTFDFVGKASKRHVVEVTDPDVVRGLRTLRRRRPPPDQLLVWDDAGTWHTVRATDINTYIKDASGDDFSAKDFRTWHGTVLAATFLARQGTEASRSAARRAIRAAAQDVSEHLGNTPAVARSSYIDPRVIARYLEGEVIDLDGISLDGPEAPIEERVLALLRRHRNRAWPEAA